MNQKITRNGEPLKVPGVDDTANMSTIIGESTAAAPVTVAEKDPNFAGFINNVSFMSTAEIKIPLPNWRTATSTWTPGFARLLAIASPVALQT